MTAVVPIRPARDMPPEAPLPFPEQDLGRPFRDPAAPGCAKPGSRWIWRAVVFLPAGVATLLVVALFTDFFALGGLSGFECLLISLIAFSFFWIAMSVAMAVAGVARTVLQVETSHPARRPLDVALLVPVHDEVPEDVFGNALAMLEDLSDAAPDHRFALFVLSDTTDEGAAAHEERAFSAMRAMTPAGIDVHYRRFPENTERKIGNIGQWVGLWGGAWEAMVVLDADSLMTAGAILTLADAMAADPAAGLVQSTPRIIEAETVFGRIQQFGTAVYGPLLSAGLASWTGREGNYWGHNAIVRTRAFAAAAGLPRIGRRRSLVLSHDFVEAALLRRAGWSVRMLPAEPGSYEEAPATLPDYVRRDARWCRGNLQHLRLLTVPGLHPVSRFHLFQGAMSYLVSLVWLALLFTWAAIGVGQEKSLIVYFSGNDPRPHWPELTGAREIAVLAFIYGMLLAPKFIGALRMLAEGGSLPGFGGRSRFVMSLLAEILLSVAYAPILMVQQTRAVVGAVLGRDFGWQGYRGPGRRGPSEFWLARFHCAETALGSALTLGIAMGFVTPWLLPIGLSLLSSVPLSRFSGVRLSELPRLAWLMATPETLLPPRVIELARARQAELNSALARPFALAAE